MEVALKYPYKLGIKKFKMTLDTGCGTGLQLTDVIDDKIDYTILDKTELLNRDGSHRGWSKKN